MTRQIFVRGPRGLLNFEIDPNVTIQDFSKAVYSAHGVVSGQCYLTTLGGLKLCSSGLACDTMAVDLLEIKFHNAKRKNSTTGEGQGLIRKLITDA